MIVYFNNRYLPIEEVKISPYDRGFQYADGVYEALRSYNGKLFQFESHIRRLKHSLAELNIKFDNFDTLESISLQLAEMNKILPDNFSVYIQITRGVQFPRNHSFNIDSSPTIFVSVSGLKDNEELLERGVKVVLEKDIRWTRCDIKSVSILPAIMANTKAIKSGAYEAIFHRDDLITEGSHTNFFAVKNGILYTAPLSNLILEGITRDVVIELSKKNNIPTVEEYIKVSELKTFNDFFITGTITEITPVIQIGDWMVGKGIPGEMTKLIQRLFNNYVYSK